MAVLTDGFTRCKLCGELLMKKDEMVCTTHFIANMADPLWRYSDAAMHKTCFMAWIHRKQFISKYNQHHCSHGSMMQMTEDGEILVHGGTKNRLRKRQHSYKWNERRARKEKRRRKDDIE